MSDFQAAAEQVAPGGPASDDAPGEEAKFAGGCAWFDNLSVQQV